MTESDARAAWNRRTVDEEGVKRAARCVQDICAYNCEEWAYAIVRAYLGLDGGGER
jgi:hypothetical protein